MGTDKKVLMLVDEKEGKFQCKVCGRIRYANLNPVYGGRYANFSWQCENGCKLPKAVDTTDQPTQE